MNVEFRFVSSYLSAIKNLFELYMAGDNNF